MAEILGVRHYSPACARLVRARVRALRPHTVLIEGPSDFNARLAELDLPHQLPIALYSYYGTAEHTRSCFAPFAEFAPEWAALQAAREVGARVRFIDLPYWHPGAQALPQRYTLDTLPGRERYARVQAVLQRQCGIDGEDALWDHLYEREADAIGVDAARTEALRQALATYFDELRADEPGHPSDQAREAHMREWIAWARATPGPVLVVCGGWHQRALQGVATAADDANEPLLQAPAEYTRHGSYLVPYSEVELDAYAGYGAGMPSPLWYRWQWQHGTAHAGAQALRALLRRMRALRQPLSTAQLIQARARVLALAALRGHPLPLRCDVLDGMLDALVDGALETPPPWTTRQPGRMDGRLRELLRALSGEQRGALAAGTPQPPLVLEVQQTLAALDLTPSQSVRALTLDRRRPDDDARAEVLWRLATLGISGFQLEGLSAGNAPRQLAADQHALERWSLRQTPAQIAELIQAGAWGATLAEAAARRLQQRAREEATPAAWVDAVVAALRCGFLDLGPALAQATHEALADCAHYAALSTAARRLAALADAGFWGRALGSLLDPLLALCLQRLSWLIEGRSGGGAADPADLDAVRFLAWSRARSADPAAAAALADLLLRRALDEAAPPALRGAATGALWQAETHVDAAAVIAAARRFAAAEALGDWLIGLFALAREVVTRSPALIVALDPLIAGYSDQAFLTALPALKQAFGWFPPRERAAIAERVAELHGHGSALAALLLTLPEDAAQAARGSALQQRVREQMLHWGLA